MSHARSRAIATASVLALVGASVVASAQAASAAVPDNQVTEIVSYGPNGENGRGSDAVISRDGSTVMFWGEMSLHRPAETSPFNEYTSFVRDLTTGELTMVAEGVDGLSPDNFANDFNMASDGQFVVFSSRATNLTVANEGTEVQVYRWNRATGVNELVSVPITGIAGDSSSYETAISADGRYIAFASYATNLVAGDTNGARDLFLRDMQTGATTRLLEDIEENYTKFELSGDGDTLVFATSHPLVPGDTNGEHDIHTLDISSGVVTMVTVATDGTPAGTGGSHYPGFSTSYDGSLVSFDSDGGDFVTGDTNGVWDVFVRDMTSGTTTLVSRDLNGGLADSGSSGGWLSSNGRFVAFSSSATDLTDPDIAGGGIYLRDLVAQETIWVGPTGDPQFGDSSWHYHTASDDGLVAFMSYAGSLVGETDVHRIFLRNVAPVITSGSAPTDVDENEPYAGYTVTVTGRDKSFTPTFGVSSGSLPPGLTLGASTGAITGTTTADGTFDFTVTATTSAGSGSKALTITVLPEIVTVLDEPSIGGTPIVDGTLTADPGEWDPAGTTFTYQWSVGGAEVDDATAQTYTPVASDVGEDVSVTVTGTAPNATPVSATSGAVGPVVKADLTTATPVISDTTPSLGQTISIDSGEWGPAPVAFSYQWEANGIAISGATGTSLELTAAEVGDEITVVVTGTKAGYNNAIEESGATAEVAAGDLGAAVPTITGTPKAGATVTVLTGTWAPPGVTLSYQWQADGVDVGTDSTTYSPVASDVGKVITVEVTGSLDGYGDETEESAPTFAVVKGDLTGTIDFTGTLMFGETLTTVETGWDGAELTYEWFADGVSTGTGGAYVLDATDVSKDITVQVTAVRAGYNAGLLESQPQGPVGAAPMVPAVPTIDDSSPAVGDLLGAIVGTWSPSGVAFGYQWLANGTDIAGATGSTYEVQSSDLGDTLSVRVTGTKAGHTPTSSTSDETSPVVNGDVSVERVSGASRYEGAIAISQAAFPGTAAVVYVATGTNYPDALSAAPAAVAEGAPLLLVPSGAIPSNILAEINRLDPAKIVVVGGTGVVSPAAFSQLQEIATTVRMSGVNRYATSRAVVEGAFDSADTAYIATGRNFPDALSASGAGGATGSPVVLVDGRASQADLATKNLLTALEVDGIKAVGGSAVVSNGVMASLQSIAPVTRLGGGNRYDVSVGVNRDAFQSSEFVFLATGLNFPDALAGAAWAGKANAPLYIVPGTCVPRGVLDDIDDLGATTVYLLGGTGVLSNRVMDLAPCA